MTNPTLDNSIANDSVVLWQYDKAYNLLALIDKWNSLGEAAVTQFWDYWQQSVASIDTADTYGLNVWGRLMGIPRPRVTVSGTTSDLSNDLYRRLLKARFFLNMRKPTTANYEEYLHILFPAADYVDEKGVSHPRHNASVTDWYNMSITFGLDGLEEDSEEYALADQHHDLVFIYPAGIRYYGTDGLNIRDDLVIGTEGQKLRNFADGYENAGTDTDYPKAGIVSESSNANYEKEKNE